MTPIGEALERVLALSEADACVAVGRASSVSNVRWANNASTTNGVADSTSLSIASIRDGRVGSVSVTHFPSDKLEWIVRTSEAACEGKPPAPDVVDLVAGDGAPAGWADPWEPAPTGVFERFSPDLAEVFSRADGEDVLTFGYAEHSSHTELLATSGGVRRRHRRPTGYVQVTAKTPDFERSAWVQRATSDFSDVDAAALYDRLAQRLEWSKDVTSLEPGDYEVILEPQATSDMLAYLYWSLTAREAQEGRSAFSRPGGGTLVGKRLFAPGVSLYSDPREPGLDTAPFVASTASSSYGSLFDSGMDLQRTEWAGGGVLQTLICPRWWARQTDCEPAPYVGNLVMPSPPQAPTLEDMIASTERALLVTRFWYIRMLDPQTLLLTGLTRDGVFLVEDGAVRGAVNNFRFNESPVAMLERTLEIGRTEQVSPTTKVPPIRVAGFHMSSVSEAT